MTANITIKGTDGEVLAEFSVKKRLPELAMTFPNSFRKVFKAMYVSDQRPCCDQSREFWTTLGSRVAIGCFGCLKTFRVSPVPPPPGTTNPTLN